MVLGFFALCGSALLLAIVAASAGAADELPMRKPGYWENKGRMDKMPAAARSSIWHECVNAASEKKLGLTGDVAKKMCPKINVQRTGNGYVVDTECIIGNNSIAQHMEITGSFESATTVKTSEATTEAKWLGACPADWKAGDQDLPGMPGRKVDRMDLTGD